MAGWVHADAKKDEGRGVMRQCFPDSFSGYQIVSAKTFPENGAGVSGRMLLVYVQANTGSTKSCRVIFERYDAADPAGLGCP